jgi:hypothetical protein
MMRYPKLSSIVCFFALLLGCVACSGESPKVTPLGNAMLVFDIQVESMPLEINKPIYKQLETSYQIEKFAFYVSNIMLKDTKTKLSYKVPESYHLLNFNDNKLSINLDKVPTGNYDSLFFGLGIDSQRNTSLDQIGDLDPNNGMAWDWKTGYKFLSVEGKLFPTNQNPKGLVVHIGTDENYQNFAFALPTMTVGTKKPSICKIMTNIAAMFNGGHRINFLETNSIMGGENAKKIAQNSKNCFKITSVE